MIRFNNDYSISAHPEILKALTEDAENAYPGYMVDCWCDNAKEAIQKYIKCPEADIHFCVGGTQANYVIIAASLRHVESVLCADTGHINVHESGSVENAGIKIETVPGTDGKITAKQVEAYVSKSRNNEMKDHITQPGMVYISFPTEYGTLYSKSELKALRKVCDKYGMLFFIDGARMSYGICSNECDVTLEDITKLSDVYYIGGTKCGAMFGEAIVIRNEKIKPMFKNFMKQNGAVLAKGWLLGIQFYTLFKDGLYFEIAKNADTYAKQIKEHFVQKNVPIYIDSCTNQQFVVLDKKQAKKLSKNFVYEHMDVLDDGREVVRFCTAWFTKKEDVEVLLKEIDKL